MKNNLLKTGLLLFIGLLIVSFTSLKVVKKNVDTSKSSIEWLGTKVTGKHKGTIKLKSGSFNFEAKKLVGGEFVVDMTTIVCTDLQGEYKGKLENHLNSDDFFGVASFPEAHFKITKIAPISPNKYNVTGDLTIKGTSLEHTFTLDFDNNKANGTIVIDRSKFDIRYGSGSFFDNLGDKTIHDNFELKVALVF